MSESVTAKLYALYKSDMRIRGLRSRLDAAERFLGEQNKHLDGLRQRSVGVDSQLKQLRATIANDEGEVAQIDERINELRERMNTATSNREYKATLAEVNTLKENKAEIEERAIANLEKADELSKQQGEITSATGEREKMREVAERDRTARADEIREKLTEAERERASMAEAVPSEALTVYEELLTTRGEDAMAPLEVVDAKRHEYICGSSMMSVPVEIAISLLNGKLTLSPNDGCILYLDAEAEEKLAAAAGKK